MTARVVCQTPLTFLATSRPLRANKLKYSAEYGVNCAASASGIQFISFSLWLWFSAFKMWLTLAPIQCIGSSLITIVTCLHLKLIAYKINFVDKLRLINFELFFN